MRAATVLAAVLLAGCSGVFQAPPPARALCYATADLRAQARVDSECRIGDAGVPFDECPARDEILEQLQRDQEACL